jgi:NSS family neurotransmitter:Na+ symporter
MEALMAATPSSRGTWGSKLAFILAAAGSAIGLGNIWRFPTTTGRSGGAAFVLIYLGCVLMLGLPVMLAELSLGRRTEKNPVGAFAAIAPRTAWKLVGMLGVITGIAILSYYSVIAGWTVGYIIKAFAGEFAHIASPDQITASFTSLIDNPASALGLHALFIALTMAVVAGGVQGGIERWSKILMPMLFLILALLVVRSITLPGAAVGLRFYLQPDFSKVTMGTVMNAMGQAFFSLSLGMGAMITYGSYLSKRESLFSAAAWVCLADTAIALLAGFAIFPALFTIPGLQPTEGSGLIFVVLPNVFDHIPGGTFFGAGFFILLAVAALTSTISLLEVVVAYVVDEKGWSRHRAVLVFGTVSFLVGIPSALGSGAVKWLTELPFGHESFLDLMDFAFGNLSLAVGAVLLSLFVGWRWGMRQAVEEIHSEGLAPWLPRAWSVLLRFVCPVAIVVILVRLVMSSLGL